ncbi:MAG: SurA N-terminal domain-containing protein [Gammaproteobacteria bacterium]|nr:SurA N-terminal domain-containing protein [Gammaproteobacteria bacterium]
MALFKKFFLCMFLLVTFQTVSYAETLDKVIAIVNSEPITQNELNQQISIAKSQLQSAKQPVPSDSVLRKKVLDQLIDMKLQLQIAKKAHLSVSDTDLTKTIAGIAAKNNMTTDQLKSAIEAHNMNYADYREQIRREIILSQVAQTQVVPTIKLSDAEVQQEIAKLTKKGMKGDLEKKAKMILLQKKYPEAMKNWIDQLRSQAYVKILSP